MSDRLLRIFRPFEFEIWLVVECAVLKIGILLSLLFGFLLKISEADMEMDFLDFRLNFDVELIED